MFYGGGDLRHGGSDDAIVTTAIHFDHTQVRAAEVSLDVNADSQRAGGFLSQSLPHSVSTEGGRQHDKLAHILVLSDGLGVNGSDLVRGLVKHLPEGVAVTGDGARFGTTLVFKHGDPQKRVIAAVGLYGNRLKVGFGSSAVGSRSVRSGW